MIRGRHRGLPVAIDRAVIFPPEFSKEHMDEAAEMAEEPDRESEESEREAEETQREAKETRRDEMHSGEVSFEGSEKSAP